MVAQGVRGVTSNPTILAKAIESEDAYDEQFGSLLGRKSIEDIYWELAIADIRSALGLLRPLHDASQGEDGFVSLEVSPSLAHDTPGTVSLARELHDRIGAGNLYVKVPATKEGVGAIKELISQAKSINVTLIFGLERYQEVMEAYLGGLEACAARGGKLAPIRSVASFFVSRVDTEVDRRLTEAAGGENGDPQVLAMRGKAAVAQARVAYQRFTETFSGPRWEALAKMGANLQRPLWASTSTKNPAYSDLLYVDSLIGPNTVSTMPEGTIAAFQDHGTLARAVDADPSEAAHTMAKIAEVGVDWEAVSERLEDEGVDAFAKSFDELMGKLSDKAAALDSTHR
ncbi:MAG: transaldolase [Acidimicrobiales bacterium]